MEPPTAPDGGWGWVVCFGCFMMNIVNGGVGFSFGVVFPELLDHFRGSQAETSSIFSLALFVSLFLGPVFAALTSRFGCRSVAIAGCIISFISYLASALTPNLHFLYFSMGILAGIGDGAVYLSIIVCINEYFDKHRAFATGIVVCGAGVGTFIFNPLTTLLIETYAWRGAILIQSGIILNYLPCCLLLRPLPHNQGIKNKGHIDIPEISADMYLKQRAPLSRSAISDDEPEATLLDDFDDKYSVNHGDERKGLDISGQLELQINTLQQNNGTRTVKSVSIDTVNIILEERSDNMDNETLTATVGDLVECDVDRSDTVTTNQEHDISSASSKHSIQARTEQSLIRMLMENINDSFSLDLLKQKPFTLFAVSSFFNTVGYYIPYVYLPVMSESTGVSAPDAAWILSTVGISSTIARVLFGYLSDRRWMNRLYLYSTSLLICGVGSFLTTTMVSFYGLMTYAAVFGTFSGATTTLESVLTCDLVGKANLSPAFGIIYLVAGIGSLFGAPLAGWLYDISGSYSSTFMAAGATFIVAGATMFTIPYIDKHWKK